MRVLWVSAAINGPAADILGVTYDGCSGGWIKATYEQMKKDENFKNVEMFYLCSSKSIKKHQIVKSTKNNETAYCVRMNRISFGIRPKKYQIKQFMKIIDEIKPDIINIWGTEMTTNYLASLAARDIPCVLYFQGVLGIHSKYLGGYIDRLGDTKYYGLLGRILRLKDRLKTSYFKKQAVFEKNMVLTCKNVITDNAFVSGYVKSIAKNSHIFLNSYELSDVFFKHEWVKEKSDSNSIFTVFGRNTDKGLSQLLKALVIVKQTYPNVVLNLPGQYQPIGKKSIKKSLKMLPFEIWLENFIIKNNLRENVKFVGKLNATQMAEKLQESAVFVNPSIMENTATGLREALAVGTPSITSLCGSINEIVTHQENGLLYRYEEHEILASHICDLLGDHALAVRLSNNAKKRSRTDFYRESFQSLIAIYNQIIIQEKGAK